MPTILLDAIDTLYFRDGKPFTMGDDTTASGTFPPYPSVLYGALRSAWFAENMSEFSKVNTPQDPTRNLVIHNIFLTLEEDLKERFFPFPNDILVSKSNKGINTFPLRLEEENLPISNGVCVNAMLVSDEKGKMEETAGKYVASQYHLINYLKKDKRKILAKSIQEYLKLEPKIGISRNSLSHITEEGHLYRTHFQRLINGLQIGIDYEGLNFKQSNGLMRIGGEGKAAAYKHCEIAFDTSIEIAHEKNYFKIYLATPAIFVKGDWYPQNIFDKHEITLLTAAIGKPLSIGGFDIKERKPKMMYKAVPAGTVYYVKAKDKDSLKYFYETYHQKSISDIYANQGFGIIYLGNI